MVETESQNCMDHLCSGPPCPVLEMQLNSGLTNQLSPRPTLCIIYSVSRLVDRVPAVCQPVQFVFLTITLDTKVFLWYKRRRHSINVCSQRRQVWLTRGRTKHQERCKRAPQQGSRTHIKYLQQLYSCTLDQQNNVLTRRTQIKSFILVSRPRPHRIANVPTSGNLISARGHFLSENGVPDTVQFQQGFLSPQRRWTAGLHYFKVSRGTFSRKSI